MGRVADPGVSPLGASGRQGRTPPDLDTSDRPARNALALDRRDLLRGAGLLGYSLRRREIKLVSREY